MASAKYLDRMLLKRYRSELSSITAKSMGHDFDRLMEQRLFPALGMKSSYINVPEAKMADYAQGYTKEGAPIRMATGVLSFEAYGIKATASDLLRFVEPHLCTAFEPLGNS